MTELTQDLLRGMFDYRDGNLYWRISKALCIRIGDLAGAICKDGYREIRISYKPYKAHRLIFLYHHGYLPKYLDHIDGDLSNNSISNLREATSQENSWNRKKSKSMNGKSTSSVYKGVSWHKQSKKWRTRIQVNGKRESIGLFTSETEAARAYDKSANELFGKFANMNIGLVAP